MLPSPVPPITLQDVGKATKVLQTHGATIQQLNLVRKNIELLKGGGLAKQALPAKVIIYYTHTPFNEFRSQHGQRVNPTDMYRFQCTLQSSQESLKSQKSIHRATYFQVHFIFRGKVCKRKVVLQ